MAEQPLPRRSFVKAAALSAAGAALGGLSSRGVGEAFAASTAGETATAAGSAAAVKLGVASYSLRKFPRARAIEMVKALRTPYINIKSFHLEYALPPAEIAAARREFEAAGLQIVGGGTITFSKDTDEDVRAYFEYAKNAGMPVMVSTADPKILPRIERFAKQYDIKVAIHNHGPEDKHYPSPYDVLKHVQGMDPRMGLCIDIGHTVRTGTDVVRAIADAGPRLLDMHAKDLRDLKVKESQCIVGEGAIPIADIFRQLQAMNYQGYVNLEYEIDADDPLPGMQRSFAYMRGVLAGLVPAAPAAAAARTSER
jgi:sugar phosphate isomerase/epimerase